MLIIKKPIRDGNVGNNNYIEYESNGDKNKKTIKKRMPWRN